MASYFYHNTFECPLINRYLPCRGRAQYAVAIIVLESIIYYPVINYFEDVRSKRNRLSGKSLPSLSNHRQKYFFFGQTQTKILSFRFRQRDSDAYLFKREF